jgi:hypothetical protein
MAWLSGWKKRIKVTVDNTKVDVSLSNFPILIKISTSSGITSADVSAVFDELVSDTNRKKIAVTTSNGTTECYVEIERWDDASELAWLHVKAPSISNSADEDFYLYYDVSHADNTTYVGDVGDTPAQSVWDANFTGVYHLNENPATENAKDSTASPNNLTPSTNKPTLIDSKVGKGYDFELSSQNYLSGSTPADDTFTIEAVVKPESFTGGFNGIAGWTNGTSRRELETETTSGYIRICYGANKDKRATNYALSLATDYYVAVGYDGSEVGNVNENEVTWSGEGSVSAGISNTLRVGRYVYSTGYYWDGEISEVRMSDIKRTSEWRKATYYSLFDNFATFGSEETNQKTDDLDVILESKKQDLLDGILAGYETLNNDLDVILEGKINNLLDVILKGKIDDDLDAILKGKTYNELSSILQAFITLNNDIDGILVGKILDELDVLVHVKETDDLDIILRGITKDFIDVILQGKDTLTNDLFIILKAVSSYTDDLDVILKGKIPDDQQVIIQGRSFNEASIVLQAIDILELASRRLTLLDKIKLRSTAVYSSPRSLIPLKLVYGDWSTSKIKCEALDEYGYIHHISDRQIMSINAVHVDGVLATYGYQAYTAYQDETGEPIACVVFDNPQYDKQVTVNCKGIVDKRDGSLIENPANLIRDLLLNVQEYIDDVIDETRLSQFYSDCLKEEIKVAPIIDQEETIKAFFDRLALNIHSRWMLSDGKSVMKLRWL